MNGLTLRISGGGCKKNRNTCSFSTVSVPVKYLHVFGANIKQVEEFIKAPSVDKQLVILKSILSILTSSINEDFIKFLVVIFLQAEVKHPVKCYLTRSITKSDSLHQPFSVALSKQIAQEIAEEPTNYKDYADVVTKVASCIENFPAGTVAIKNIEIELAQYLKNGLTFVVKTLRDRKSLSPTEKNEIFLLTHSMQRLVLYIVQKVSSNNVAKLTPMFMDIRLSLRHLLFDEDVPMDTKSVCGIVYVSMHLLENGPDSWVYLLKNGEKEEMLQSFLENDASRLSLFSAVVIVVPTSRLQVQNIDDVPALLALTENVVAIGERTSSDATFNLGVTRTLLQISKTLDKNINDCLGLQLVDYLLMFVWAHLEHHMDSVRHLTAQVLACVVRYCTRLQGKGDSTALDKLFSALNSLDRSRKSFYVCLTALTSELGSTAILDRMPDLVRDIIRRLSTSAIQACATTALENLLEKHIAQCTSEQTYTRWVQPTLAHAAAPLDAIQLAVLESLLTKAVKLDDNLMDFLVPHIRQKCDDLQNNTNSCIQYDLKCILMLLSVARKSGVMGQLGPASPGQWRNIISYDVLRKAAVNSLQETRILSLSLIVESPKSTEIFTAEELDFVLYFLKYNANAQSPNFRQLVLSSTKKFIKRFEDSYKVLLRQKGPNEAENKVEYYLHFVESLRAHCFDSLLEGANYGRRYVALQVLVWCEHMHLDGYERKWTEKYVEKLLLHLEDSYENNKAFALDVLKQCPGELLKRKVYSTSLDLRDIMSQASSVKPTDCVSAAYKLELLMSKLPENILLGQECHQPEPVAYTLLSRLLEQLQKELSVCVGSVVSAARDSPMYGLVHCITHVVEKLDAEAISQDVSWTKLIADIMETCMEVNEAVACVVNNSSPEGHLPMDMGGVILTDHGNSGNVRLDDGRQVTAQMVLLCAWRSVKEVSLLLGCMCSRLQIASEGEEGGEGEEGEGGGGSVSARQVAAAGAHLASLLAATKHRGAFEQAYLGFCALLARLWRCRRTELHELPRKWLDELMVAIQNPDDQGKLCATRRSAGLPFMIQALVTTEVQVRGNPSCFHACMSSLVRVCREEAPVASRTHGLNILRALFRNSSLHEASAQYAGAGLEVALAGFDGNTWEERNSSTLLFSALTVRIFGVQRSRETEKLCIRNKMTGRIFFLRYPRLYDLMLSKLEEMSRSKDPQFLRPSLYPILLLLARLYPSSLEGSVSNLKLVAFIPHVLACGKSAVMKTRQLAAKAMVALISPEHYVSHLEEMLSLLCDEAINRNYCHGILLQIIRLLDNKPEDLSLQEKEECSIREKLSATVWVLRQACGRDGRMPCYLIADEYLKMITSLLSIFPALLHQHITKIVESLHDLLFNEHPTYINSGRDICLANAAYLYFIISNLYEDVDSQLVFKCLSHGSYEVVLSALNYILIMHKEIDIDDKFQKLLSIVWKPRNLENLNQSTYYSLLCDIIKNNCYLECSQKALKVLTLSGDTQMYIVQSKSNENGEMTNNYMLHKLMHFVQNEHENLTHIYLQSLTNFLSKLLREFNISGCDILEALRVIFACSLSDNSDSSRRVVVDFLESNIELLISLELKDLEDCDKFEFKATLYSTLVTMLEDDDATLSQRTCDLICKAIKTTGDVISSKCAELLRDHIGKDLDAVALFTLLALLDFKSVVVMTDEGNDECRVFDQNERYNVYLEETVWTRACARKIKDIFTTQESLLVHIINVIEQETYKKSLMTLCNNNLVIFKNLVFKMNNISSVDNPKIELFVKELS